MREFTEISLRYYTNIHLLLNRTNNSAELCETNRLKNGQTAQVREGSHYYYLRGCQYTSRSKGFSARAIPDGCVLSHNAPSIVSSSNTSTEYLLGWVNSRLIRSIIEMQSMADDFTPGTVKSLPWIDPDPRTEQLISNITLHLISYYRHLNSLDETDPYFVSPFWYDLPKSIGEHQVYLKSAINNILITIQKLQEQVTFLIDEIYKIDSNSLAESVMERDVTKEVTFSEPSIRDLSHSMISYSLGGIMGRFDLHSNHLSTQYPVLETLFQPIPICSPGILQNKQGLPASPKDISGEYQLPISWNGILVDDEHHPEDVVKRVREALHYICQEQAESVEQEVCSVFCVKSLCEFFRNSNLFFDDHLKRYSKSRRVAPIYWPLSTVSGSYTLWLYYHHLTDQTLYTCINDFVEPKIRQVGEQITHLRSKVHRTGAEEKELEHLSDLEAELKDLRAELLRVAAFWKPDLNDGVEITASPLWRLIPHKGWQKRLKETWQKLEAGDYDWAHLSYSIWPERVREMCKTDKSLAIAHGLEELYVEPVSSKATRNRKKKVEEDQDGLGFLDV